MKNLHNLQKFSRTHALVSHLHSPELASLATAPDRSAANTDLSLEQCAISYGVQVEKGKSFPFAGGIAVIPVYGALLHRDPWCDNYATGYDYIASRFSAALGDPDVKGIMFDVNSYGGHVAGNFELSDMIYAARGKKPMIAVVDSRALSGGYSLASSVGRIVATPSADIGSIGVVMMHMSLQQAMENFGVKVTFIYAGEHKVDGNPFEDLPKDVKAALQESVAASYEKFVALVARNRAIDAGVVRKTEARVYDAAGAKEIGLIDDVMPPSAAFASFLSEVSTASTQTKEAKKMNAQNTDAPVAAAGGDAAAPTPAPAVNSAAPTPVDASAVKAAERARIQGITACDEGKTRPTLANHLAMNTEMSVDDARKVLAASAEENTKQAAGPLATAMASSEQPNVGAIDGAESDGEQPRQSASARILAAHNKANGIKPAAARR